MTIRTPIVARRLARGHGQAAVRALLLALALGLGLAAGLLGTRALVLLAPVVLAFCLYRPAIGVVALVVACAIDRFAVPLGLNLRLDELAALALAAALAVRVTPAALRRPALPLLLPLLAVLLTNVLATLVSDNPARGVSLDILTLDLMILFLALARALTTPAHVLGAVRLWLGVAAVEAAAGGLAFALYLRAHGAVPGVQLSTDPPYGPMVYGTLYEANIFGSYMSASFLIALALAAEGSARRKGLLYPVCAMSAVGLLLSGTRSAWGATALGAALLLALLRFGLRAQPGTTGPRTGSTTRLVGGLAAVAVVVGVGLAVAPASVTGKLGARAGGILNFGSGSGYGRTLLYREAIAEWQPHKLLGLGPGSFTYRLPGDPATGPSWIPNLLLQTLHDTGALGLLALLWLYAAYYAGALRALRRAPPGESRAALAGLIAATTALLISFQLTPGTPLGYSWALLALGVAAARAVKGTAHG